MKMPRITIDRAAAQDQSRPVLNSVYFNAEKSQLVAADGFQLAILPVIVEEDDVTSIIPLDAWTKAFEAEKKATKKNRDITIGIHSTELDCLHAGIKVAYEPIEGKFPPYGAILDKCLPLPHQQPIMTINVDLLHDFAHATCEKDSPWLTLYHRQGGAMYAQALSGDGYGAVMQMNNGKSSNGLPNPTKQIIDAMRDINTGADPVFVDRQAAQLLERLGYDVPTRLWHPKLMNDTELAAIKGVFKIDDQEYTDLKSARDALAGASEDRIVLLNDACGIVAENVLGKFAWKVKP